MNGISTLTQKGQVVIPQPIRDILGLKTSSKIYFELRGKKIIAEPVLTIDEAFGMIKTHKKYSNKDFKKIIRQEVIKKYKRKNHGIS